MASPSEPLLQWLREILHKKGLNTALAAKNAGIKRSRARRILSGVEPMTVDELLQLCEALSLSPADMGAPVPLPEAAEPPEVEDLDPADFTPTVNPWLNHHKQLFQIAFALGSDFAFTARVDALSDSGIPASVLDMQRGNEMMIQLDALYHSYNNPVYETDHVTLTLSFDAVYDCRFPWEAIQRVFFSPVPLADLEGDADEPQTPHLRLVT